MGQEQEQVATAPVESTPATGVVPAAENTTPESAEAKQEQSAEDIFMEAATGKKEEKKEAPASAEKKDDKKTDPEDPAKKIEQETKDAEELKKDEEADKVSEEQDKAKQEQQQKPSEPFNAGKYVSNFVESFPLKEEIDLGNGSKVNFKEVAEAYPDLFNSMILMSSHIANTLIDQAINSGEIAKGKDFSEIKDGILKEKFDSDLNRKQTGATDIINSEAFESWKVKQPKAIADLSKSKKIDDVLYAIKLFNVENKAGEEFKKKKDLAKGSLKQAPAPQESKKKDEDPDEIWKEAIKQD